ncbi:hypothetical protein Dimus_026657 [Dionaea muscipula]
MGDHQSAADTGDHHRGLFDLYLVQEIASLNNNEAPQRFIHKQGYPPADHTPIWQDQLLIDLSLLSSSSQQPTAAAAAAAELRKLQSALTTWGCFQVFNFYPFKKVFAAFLVIPLLTRASRKSVMRCSSSARIFLPCLSRRSKNVCSGAANPFQGYGNDIMLYGNQILNRNDRLYLKLYPQDQSNLKYWPEKPEDFRQIIVEYGTRVRTIPEVLLKAMACALDLKDTTFLDQHGENGGALTARINFYPRCRSPEYVLGVKPHSDGSMITILLQDKEVDGLQVQKDGKWYKVPVIPGSLFVNAGDLAEVMSNGIFKSTVHRVVTNTEKDRVSLAVFYSSSSDEEFGPAYELVNAERPCLYKKISMKDYGKLFIQCSPLGVRTLDALKL